MEEKRQARQLLVDLLGKLNVVAVVSEKEAPPDGQMTLNIESDRNAALIGYHGEGLSALQHILNLILRSQVGEEFFVRVDVGSYREQEEQRAMELARFNIKKVIEGGQESPLRAMSANERRIVHLVCSEFTEVECGSVGIGADRHIVIKKK